MQIDVRDRLTNLLFAQRTRNYRESSPVLLREDFLFLLGRLRQILGVLVNEFSNMSSRPSMLINRELRLTVSDSRVL